MIQESFYFNELYFFRSTPMFFLGQCDFNYTFVLNLVLITRKKFCKLIILRNAKIKEKSLYLIHARALSMNTRSSFGVVLECGAGIQAMVNIHLRIVAVLVMESIRLYGRSSFPSKLLNSSLFYFHWYFTFTYMDGIA